MIKEFFIALILLGIVACIQNTPTTMYDRSWNNNDRTFLLSQLDSSLNLIITEVKTLDEEQWNWRAEEADWTIHQIVEHLIVHDELFYREARVLTGLDVMMPQVDALFSDDETIISYREITPENKGKAPAYLEPIGRWCSKEEALAGYQKIRQALIQFVAITNKDLRKYYTSSGRGPTKFRDLHQLLLISVAHTQRHYQQIVAVKERFRVLG